MKNRLFLAVAVVMTAFVVSGCGKMPQESIDAAKAAVVAAKTAQADVYMAPEYKALEDSLNSVIQGIEAENSNFLKDFDALKAKLDTLTAQAERVAQAVPAKREAVKAEAEAMIATVKNDLETTKALLKKAPKGKEGKAALEQMTNELNVVTASVSEIETALAGDVNYAEALDKLNAAQKSVTDINTELTEAIAKKNRK